MLQGHRSTFRPTAGDCETRLYAGMTAASFGIGEGADASFDANDDFISLGTPSDLQTYHIPSGTSRIKVYLGSDGTTSLCVTVEDPCADGEHICEDVNSECCPDIDDLGICCNRDAAGTEDDPTCSLITQEQCFKNGGDVCWHPTVDGDGNCSAGDGKCSSLADCSAGCGKKCCDPCSTPEECEKGFQLCRASECEDPGEPTDDCTNCGEGVFYFCSDSKLGDPNDPSSTDCGTLGCNGSATEGCLCQEIDECEASKYNWDELGVKLYSTKEDCEKQCIPRWACCADDGIPSCVDKARLDPNNPSGPLVLDFCLDPAGNPGTSKYFCTERGCNQCCVDGCGLGKVNVDELPPSGTSRVAEGDFLTTAQTTFLNQGKFTLSTATALTKRQAAAYNNRLDVIALSGLKSISPGVRGDKNTKNEDLLSGNIDISIQDKKNILLRQAGGCNVCGDVVCTPETCPSGKQNCGAPDPALVIYEYNVGSLCQVTNLELTFESIRETPPAGQNWYDGDKTYRVTLRYFNGTDYVPLLQDEISRGHLVTIGNLPDPPTPVVVEGTYDCVNCSSSFDCSEIVNDTNHGEYRTFAENPTAGLPGQVGFSTNAGRLLNTRNSTHLLQLGGDEPVEHRILTRVQSAGSRLEMIDSVTEEDIPVIIGGPSEDDPFDDEINWDVITNQLRWDDGRIESELEGVTYIAGNAAGALSHNYCVNGLGDCVEPGNAGSAAGHYLFGAVLKDAGYTFQSQPEDDPIIDSGIEQDSIIVGAPLEQRGIPQDTVTSTDKSYNIGQRKNSEIIKTTQTSANNNTMLGSILEPSPSDPIQFSKVTVSKVLYGASAGIAANPLSGRFEFSGIADAVTYLKDYVIGMRVVGMSGSSGWEYGVSPNVIPSGIGISLSEWKFTFSSNSAFGGQDGTPSTPPDGFKEIVVKTSHFEPTFFLPLPGSLGQLSTAEASLLDENETVDIELRSFLKPNWKRQSDAVGKLFAITESGLSVRCPLTTGSVQGTIVQWEFAPAEGPKINTAIYDNNIRNYTAGSGSITTNPTEIYVMFEKYDSALAPVFPTTHEHAVDGYEENYAPYVAIYMPLAINGNSVGWHVYERSSFQIVDGDGDYTVDNAGKARKVEYRTLIDSPSGGTLKTAEASFPLNDSAATDRVAKFITLKRYNKGDFEFWEAPTTQ